MKSGFAAASAGLSGLAAIIHAYVTPEHFREAWILGAFFLVLAVLQAAFAFEILRAPRHGLLLGGIFLNAMVIVIYVVTRTIGVPFGDHVEPEAVGLLDVVVTLSELILIMFLVAMLPRYPDERSPRHDPGRPSNAPHPPPPRSRTAYALPQVA